MRRLSFVFVVLLSLLLFSDALNAYKLIALVLICGGVLNVASGS